MPKSGSAASSAGAASLQRLQEEQLAIAIRGLTPYIPHDFGAKAMEGMPGHPKREQLGPRKGVRQPHEEAEACLYRLPDGRLGAPAAGIRAAMIGASGLFGKAVTKVNLKMALYVVGEGPDQLVPLEGELEREPWESPVHNADLSWDLRYRYRVFNWSAIVRVRFIPSVISAESVVALLDAGGKAGIGDWRPSSPKSSTGTYGRWEVVAEGAEEAA